MNEALSKYSDLLAHLFASAPELQADAPQTLEALIKLEKETIIPLQKEQKKQQKHRNRLEQINEKTRAAQQVLLDTTDTLYSYKAQLEKHLNAALLSQKSRNTPQIETEQLIHYAHTISRYTAAPHTGEAFPPIPQDNHMKRSLLFQGEKEEQNVTQVEGERVDLGAAFQYNPVHEEVESEGDDDDLLDLDL